MAQPDPIEARVITVSREALRADLAEMELRLTEKINEAVQHKADIAMVQAIDNRITTIEREAVRRDGPAMRDILQQVRDIETKQRDAAVLIPEFRRLQEDHAKLRLEFRSDAELKEMMRAERTGAQGATWTWVGRLQAAVTIFATVVALYLTIHTFGP